MVPRATFNTGGGTTQHEHWTATTSRMYLRPAAHTAVWTGSEMIVWGGYVPTTIMLRTPAEDTIPHDSWTATSITNAPERYLSHGSMDWQRNDHLGWFGVTAITFEHGGRYDPHNSWTSTTTTNAPTGQDRHTAVWTGSEMIVWGGNGPHSQNRGEVYCAQPHGVRLGNISTRAFVQTGDDVMIGGFIVQGTGPKSVIMRAIGPELTPYGVPNALADPTLELHNGTGALIASNDNWQTTIIGGIITSNQVSDDSEQRPRSDVARESAIIADLPPGNYTAIVRGVNNTIGVALVEVYDLNPNTTSILGNISTRALCRRATT